jgi:hypothetical protein
MSTPQQALVISCHGSHGEQFLTGLEKQIGAPCAADSGGQPVYAEQRNSAAVSRIFEAPPGLAAMIGSASVELTTGVTATIETRMPSAVSIQGAGAGFWRILASTPGLRPHAFPPLAGAWVRAIERAACGVRP